jgi:hypothetical protein
MSSLAAIDIAQAVREALASASLSQAQVAQLTGIPLTTLNRRLNARGRPFLVSEVFMIAKTCQTKAYTICERAEALRAAREASRA